MLRFAKYSLDTVNVIVAYNSYVLNYKHARFWLCTWWV